MSLIMLVSFAACGKVNSSTDKSDTTSSAAETKSAGGVTADVTKALGGNTLKESTDNTNTYTFKTDGTYSEQYKGNELKGTWAKGDNDTVVLTYSETVQYVYSVDRDDNNNVVGLSQVEGRSFIF